MNGWQITGTIVVVLVVLGLIAGVLRTQVPRTYHHTLEMIGYVLALLTFVGGLMRASDKLPGRTWLYVLWTLGSLAFLLFVPFQTGYFDND